MSIISSSAYAQKTYKLSSIPIMDSLGNVYGIEQTYDHNPNAEDSAIFFKQSRISVSNMIDSIHNANNQQLRKAQSRIKSKGKNVVNKNHQ